MMYSIQCRVFLACGQPFCGTYDDICGCMSFCCHILGAYANISLDGASICACIASKKEIYILKYALLDFEII